jgi:hypothetical protein
LGKLKEIDSDVLGRVFEHSCKGFQSPRGPESYASLLGAFGNLLSRNWFKRAWVMQEIVLSPRKRFHCGQLSILWDEVIDACNVIMKDNVDNLLNGYPGEPSCRMVCRYGELAQFWSNIRHVQSDLPLPGGISREVVEQNSESALAFLAILVLARNLDATDPRDKIFAFSNMVYGHSRGEMPEIDYGISLAELYTRIALSWAEHHGGLQFLNCVQNTLNTHGLPSWVPDWSQPWDAEPLGLRLFNAGGNKPCKITFPEVQKPYSFPVSLFCEGVRLMSVRLLTPRLQSWEDLERLGIETRLQDPYPISGETYCKAVTTLISLEPKNTNTALVKSLRSPFWEYKKIVQEDKVSVASGNLGKNGGPGQINTPQSERQPDRLTVNDPELYEMNSRFYTISITSTGLFSKYRQFMISELGFLGLLSSEARAGDEIVLFPGGHTPFVLRKRENGRYRMVGECFIHGIMSGEAAEDVPPGEFETFALE